MSVKPKNLFCICTEYFRGGNICLYGRPNLISEIQPYCSFELLFTKQITLHDLFGEWFDFLCWTTFLLVIYTFVNWHRFLGLNSFKLSGLYCDRLYFLYVYVWNLCLFRAWIIILCLLSRKAVAEQQKPLPASRVEELRSSPAEGSISPGSQSSGSDRAARERQRLEEQERRRREVVSFNEIQCR